MKNEEKNKFPDKTGRDTQISRYKSQQRSIRNGKAM